MEKTFSTPEPVRLVVENEVGFVEVSARQTDTSTVLLSADTPGAEELVERTVVECRPTGRRQLLVVKVPGPRQHGRRFIRRNGVTVRVTVPEGSDISIMTASADVEVSGPVGDADLATSSGDVSTDDVGGDVSAKSASGNITVGNVAGGLRVHTASGDLRCSSVARRALFSTASGDVEIGSAAEQVDVKTTSGNARLGEVAHGARITGVSGDVRVLALVEGALRVRSVSGNVDVGVAPGVDLEVDVETMSGSVQSDIPLDQAPSDRRGGARVEISVRSVSGDVAIEHALEQVA
jgi:DUF4097 and DUF4098 domain-containing protein YvlB